MWREIDYENIFKTSTSAQTLHFIKNDNTVGALQCTADLPPPHRLHRGLRLGPGDCQDAGQGPVGWRGAWDPLRLRGLPQLSHQEHNIMSFCTLSL